MSNTPKRIEADVTIMRISDEASPFHAWSWSADLYGAEESFACIVKAWNRFDTAAEAIADAKRILGRLGISSIRRPKEERL